MLPIEMRHTIALQLLLMAAPALAAEPLADELIARRVEAYTAPFDAAGDLSGTLLVAIGGRVVFERSYGMASFELSVANEPSTRFNVASVAKPMTQIVALRLVENGRLSFDEPLSRWLPDFPRGDEITVRHLVTHRSGIPHHVTDVAEEAEPQNAETIARLAAGRALLFAPGSQESYSSGGYSVLARVLELAAGRPFEELLAEQVFAPAGAHDAVSHHGRQPIGRLATGYFRGADGPLLAQPRNLSFLVGAGAVAATARDVLAVQRALLGGAYGETARRALVRGEGDLSWNGYSAGYRAFAVHDAASGADLVFTGNLFTGAADRLRGDLRRIARGEEIAPPEVPRPATVALDAAVRRRLEGDYRLSEERVERLRFLDSTTAQLGEWILFATGESAFFSPQDYAAVRVERDDDGAPLALGWGPPEWKVRFARVSEGGG